ncbi:unnamed protein product [Closterium sp. NIES-54]
MAAPEGDVTVASGDVTGAAADVTGAAAADVTMARAVTTAAGDVTVASERDENWAVSSGDVARLLYRQVELECHLADMGESGYSMGSSNDGSSLLNSNSGISSSSGSSSSSSSSNSASSSSTDVHKILKPVPSFSAVSFFGQPALVIDIKSRRGVPLKEILAISSPSKLLDALVKTPFRSKVATLIGWEQLGPKSGQLFQWLMRVTSTEEIRKRFEEADPSTVLFIADGFHWLPEYLELVICPENEKFLRDLGFDMGSVRMVNSKSIRSPESRFAQIQEIASSLVSQNFICPELVTGPVLKADLNRQSKEVGGKLLLPVDESVTVIRKAIHQHGMYQTPENPLQIGLLYVSPPGKLPSLYADSERFIKEMMGQLRQLGVASAQRTQMRKIVWEPRNRTLEQGRSEEGLVEAVVKEGGLLGEEGLKQQFSNGGEEDLRQFMVQEVNILKDARVGFLVLVCGFGKGVGEQSSNAAGVVWRALQHATGGIVEDLTRELDTCIDNTSTSFSSSTGSSSSASSSSRSSSNASTISSPLPSHMLTPTTFATTKDSRAYFTTLLSSSVEKIAVKAGALPYILSPGFGEYTDCIIGISAKGGGSTTAHAPSSPASVPSPRWSWDSSGSLVREEPSPSVLEGLGRDEPSPSVPNGLEWDELAMISIFGARGEVRRVVPVLCPVVGEAVPAAALERAIREEDVRGGRVVVMRHGRFQEGEVECVRKVLGRVGARGTFVEVGESGRCRLFRALPPFAESMPAAAAAAEGAPPAAAKGAAVAAAAEGATEAEAAAAEAAAAAAEEDVYFPLSNTSAALVASSIARGMPQPMSVEIRENDLGLSLQQVVMVVAGMRRVQHGALRKAKLPGVIHCTDGNGFL